MESKKPDPSSHTKKPIAREGNKALEIDRPLFEKGKQLDFKEIKAHFLDKINETEGKRID
jgi:hypothetical protein